MLLATAHTAWVAQHGAPFGASTSAPLVQACVHDSSLTCQLLGWQRNGVGVAQHLSLILLEAEHCRLLWQRWRGVIPFQCQVATAYKLGQTNVDCGVSPSIHIMALSRRLIACKSMIWRNSRFASIWSGAPLWNIRVRPVASCLPVNCCLPHFSW